MHIGPDVAHHVRLLLADIFGAEQCRSDVVWKRTSAHNEAGQPGYVHDYILFVTKGSDWIWNQQYQPLDPSLC